MYDSHNSNSTHQKFKVMDLHFKLKIKIQTLFKKEANDTKGTIKTKF